MRSMKAQPYEGIETDVLVIGGGGAGLRAAIEAQKKNVEVVAVGKEIIGKSHTVMAEGGYNAALGNVDPKDNWETHFSDTIKGGAWLNDQELVEVLVKEAPERFYELEEFGGIFDRTSSGKLAQKKSGGASYPRTCFVSDYSGHEIIAALVDEVRRRGITFMEEVFVSKLLTSGNRVAGAVAFNMKSGNFIVFRSKAIILATGGAGRMYEITTNPASATGDGKILAIDAGAELKDMEMFQFHPTGMVWPPSCKGVLVTEVVRSAGGILMNRQGERFMERYHKMLELAPRDVVSRSIWREISEGRGTPHNGVNLTITHVPPETVKENLKTMYKQFLLAGVDITKEPMEVAPSAHHYMGGVKINQKAETSVKGLFAAGEEVGGVQGANRLGGNALPDTQVFGRLAGEQAANFARHEPSVPSFSVAQIAQEQERIMGLLAEKSGGISPIEVRRHLNRIMEENAGIVRTGERLSKALIEIENIIKKMLPKTQLTEHSTLQYHRELVDALENINLVRNAELLVRSALIRTESRGAHYRLDYPKTDNVNWLKHITWSINAGVLNYEFEPVSITLLKPPF